MVDKQHLDRLFADPVEEQEPSGAEHEATDVVKPGVRNLDATSGERVFLNELKCKTQLVFEQGRRSSPVLNPPAICSFDALCCGCENRTFIDVERQAGGTTRPC